MRKLKQGMEMELLLYFEVQCGKTEPCQDKKKQWSKQGDWQRRMCDRTESGKTRMNGTVKQIRHPALCGTSQKHSSGQCCFAVTAWKSCTQGRGPEMLFMQVLRLPAPTTLPVDPENFVSVSLGKAITAIIIQPETTQSFKFTCDLKPVCHRERWYTYYLPRL